MISKDESVRRTAVFFQIPTTHQEITATQELKMGYLRDYLCSLKQNDRNKWSNETSDVVNRIKHCSVDL